MYEASSWGYDAAEKDAEFASDLARFLVLLTASTSNNTDKQEVLAFSHFRLDHNNDNNNEDELYVWEIQVDAGHRGRGYGRLLMSVLEQLAVSSYSNSNNNVGRIALTVFRCNQAALGFYKSLRFVALDAASSNDGDEEEDYVVLYKKLRARRRCRGGAVSDASVIC